MGLGVSQHELQEQATRLIESYVVSSAGTDNPWELTESAKHILLQAIRLDPVPVAAFLDNAGLSEELLDYLNGPICPHEYFWTLKSHDYAYVNDMVREAWVQRLARIFEEHDAGGTGLFASDAEVLLYLQVKGQENGGDIGSERQLHHWLMLHIESSHPWIQNLRRGLADNPDYNSITFDDIAQALLQVAYKVRKAICAEGCRRDRSRPMQSIAEIFSKTKLVKESPKFDKFSPVVWTEHLVIGDQPVGIPTTGIGVVISQHWYDKADLAPGGIAGWAYSVRVVDYDDLNRWDLRWFNEEQLDVYDLCCGDWDHCHEGNSDLCAETDGCWAEEFLQFIQETSQGWGDLSPPQAEDQGDRPIIIKPKVKVRGLFGSGKASKASTAKALGGKTPVHKLLGALGAIKPNATVNRMLGSGNSGKGAIGSLTEATNTPKIIKPNVQVKKLNVLPQANED